MGILRAMKALRWLSVLVLVTAGFAASAAERVTYYHLDALGSPVAASDEQGNLVWREEYKPYGERTKKEPAAASNSRYYTGHPHDEDTGLTYAGARYYDPVVGRFMAVDPVPFQEGMVHSFNRYAYGNNNPYLYIDPDGEVAIIPILLWVAGAAAFVGDVFFPEPAELDQFGDAPLQRVDTYPGPVKWGKSATRAAGKLGNSAKAGGGAKDLKPTLVEENPRNLIPTQTKSEMSGSKVKRLAKDMKQNGFDQSKPVDAWRNPNTRRLQIQDGHHRTKAAKEAGLDKIPVKVWE